jgi:hypothetical protein
MMGSTGKFRAVAASAGIALAVTAGCGDRSNDRAAYEGCLGEAKQAGAPTAGATFASFEQATFGYMQDSSINVRIPYELAGKKGVYECSMMKQQDGTFKNQL